MSTRWCRCSGPTTNCSLVENAFAADVHVRGNEIAIAAADADETARVARLFEELVLLLGRGQMLDRALVRQTIRMIRPTRANVLPRCSPRR